jgi:hypothetical protein
MAIGPGKYDELATHARESAQAAGVILIVFGGANGNGFSVQADAETMIRIPSILRTVADDVERDLWHK